MCSLALATSTAVAAPTDLPTSLKTAIGLATEGRCDEALQLTREISQTDRAFYASHVPTQPALAACITKRIRDARAMPAPAPKNPDDGAGLGATTQVPLAIGASVLGFVGFGLAGTKIACGHVYGCAINDEGPDGTFVLMSSLGAIATSTAVVYLVGRDDAHDDSIAATAGGAVLAGALGTLLAAPMYVDNPLLASGVIIASSAVGATIGFHLGRSTKRVKQLEVTPTAGAGFTGAVLGGRF